MSVAERVAKIIKDRFSETEEPVLIAVGGPGGTGKSFFSIELSGHLELSRVLQLDDYKTERFVRGEKEIFGPHPEANEMELLEWHLQDIKENRNFFKPIYCSELGAIDMTETYAPVKYNILDGEISTYDRFRGHIDFSIYIDAYLSTQLKTRLTRDIKQRGYSSKKAMATFWGSNVKEYGEFGIKSREFADIILFCNEDYSLEIFQ